MLTRLQITNYALIEQLDINFSEGLTIITGETGAGKSILLGALSMILGQRADTQTLLDKQKKCIIEGKFDLRKHTAFRSYFEQHELDYEDHSIVRREISPEGKSRAFINDTPVNLNQLREFGTKLVDIHSQHETLTLNNSEFQLSVIDAYAKHAASVREYRKHYEHYLRLQLKLNELSEKEKQSKKDLDYYQFQFNELEETELGETGEQQVLELELETLNNAEEIKSALSRIHYALEGDDGLTSGLTTLHSQLSALVRYTPALNELSERLKSSYIELKDIASEIEKAEQGINYTPQRIEQINNRLTVIYQLQQKHRVATIADLLAIKDQLSQQLYNIASLDEEIIKLGSGLDKVKKELIFTAKQISAARNKVIPVIEKKIKGLLAEVGMPNASLCVESKQLENDDLNASGIDRISFLFSANKGTSYADLGKVASGGELSRLMLCLKSMIARLIELPTIIFDEIDTGVSGEVALKVGAMMEEIAKAHQVISITHLPQIASKGDIHYFVYKEVVNKKTITRVKKLEPEDRVIEIAKMLSGEKPSTIALENAKELLQM